jgi:hypothetical protein
MPGIGCENDALASEFSRRSGRMLQVIVFNHTRQGSFVLQLVSRIVWVLLQPLQTSFLLQSAIHAPYERVRELQTKRNEKGTSGCGSKG